MTVAELMKKLKSFGEDKTVFIEGCDCQGPAKDVENSEISREWTSEEDTDKTVPIVMITRGFGTDE